MASFNRFELIGNVTRDPELAFTPQKALPVVKLTLAVDGFPGADGEKEAGFYPVTVFGKQAEACAAHLKKGSLIHVDGHMKHDRWEDKETGDRRSRFDFVADRVTFLAGLKKAEPKEDAKTAGKAEAKSNAPETADV